MMIASNQVREDISTKIAINLGVIRARWILVLGLGFVGVLLKVGGQGQSTLVPTYEQIFLLLSVASAYNLFYYLYIKKRKRHTERALTTLGFLQVTVDIVVFTTVIYLAGGVDSSAYLYYVYPIIASSQLFRTRGILYSIALTTTLFTTVIGLEFFEILPHTSAYIPEFAPNHFQNPPFTFAIVINVIFSLALAGAFASVTSQIKQEHANIVQVERDRINSILESLDDGIILIDTNNRLILLNKSSEYMLRIPRKNILNLTINKSNIATLKNNENIMKLFFPTDEYKSPTLNNRYTIEFEKPVNMTLDVITIPVMDERSDIIGYLKTMHDITREKEIDRMKSEFISIAAHQLRTPLSAIKWSLKMVLDGDVGNVPKEMDALVTKTYKTNERMIRLVNDLLNVSRIEEGRFKYIYEETDLIAFLDSVVSEIKQVAKETKTKITWRRPKELPHVLADKDRLRLAVSNLLDNALKYSLHNGHITISAEPTHNDSVKITISDNGMGVPKSEQHRLFSKFYRGSNVLKQQTEGSGLGLFIVKNIINKHRGSIKYASIEGKGTTFYINLPTKPDKKKTLKEKTLRPFEKFLFDF